MPRIQWALGALQVLSKGQCWIVWGAEYCAEQRAKLLCRDLHGCYKDDLQNGAQGAM